MPSVGSSLATVTSATSTSFVPDLRWVLIACFKGLFPFFGCVSAVHQISSTGIGMSGREDRDPPDGGDYGRRPG